MTARSESEWGAAAPAERVAIGAVPGGGVRRLAIPALGTALVVGTLLTVVNHWDAVLARRVPGRGLWAQVALNFAVPFAVSLYSRWAMLRRLGDARAATGATR